MRVLQLHNQYTERGGEDTVIEEEAALLRNNGHAVELFSRSNPESARSSIVRLATSSWNLRSQRKTVQAIRRFKPDVVHLHNTWFSLSPSVLSATSSEGVPVVMTLHNYRIRCANGLFFRDGAPCTECSTGTAFHGVQHRCYRNSLPLSGLAVANVAVHSTLRTWRNRVDRYIALTEFSKDMMVSSGLMAPKIEVQPNFVRDVGKRAASPSAGDYVLFVGRITEEKGIAALIEAWGAANTSSLRLLVAGDGDLRAELEKRNVQGVEFLGQQPRNEIRKLMSEARAVAFPSIWFEGQPMVILEALSVGTPVLTSDIGGLKETVGAGGWTAAPNDRESWTAALEALRHDADVDTKGQFARALYEQTYTPERKLERLLFTYEAAIASTVI